jgi:hypothetical protein
MNRGRHHFPARSRRHTTRRPVNLRLRLLLKKRDAGRAGRRRAVPSPGLPCRRPGRGGRRVGTLPRLCLTDTCTAHDGHARAAPVPPTRREPAQSRTITRFAVPATRAGGGRRVGTLPRLCLTDTCTAHDGHARAAPVPPTRRRCQGRRGGECQAATQATPSSRRRRHAASQSPGGRATQIPDRRRRRRRPR